MLMSLTSSGSFSSLVELYVCCLGSIRARMDGTNLQQLSCWSGGVALVFGVFFENWTERSPIIPPRLFKTRTTGLIFFTVFFHALAYFAGALFVSWMSRYYRWFSCVLSTTILPDPRRLSDQIRALDYAVSPCSPLSHRGPADIWLL
ncbi:hypothetical protein B0H14DRAFT_1634889 [Mycena olivaceomarginata]|nr:hypothetical protein B0H14DRAFT_1634889 [Mycena olivaceomarginata]